MKIGLISPNDKGSYRNANFLTENLGIGYLCAYLEERGYEVIMCDARFNDFSPQTAVKEMGSKSLDILGFSIWTGEGAEWCKQFLSHFIRKQKNIRIVLGGYFPTLQPERSFEILPHADVIVMGEGEEILCNLVSAFEKQKEWKDLHGIAYFSSKEKKVITNARAKLLEDLDELPWPTRYLTEKMGEYDEVYLEGSRGCVFCCTFCAIRPFVGIGAGSAWRHRSAADIVNEIKYLRQQNPTLKTFRFIDSDFIGPAEHARAEEFALLAKQELPGIKFHAEGRAVSIAKSKCLLEKLKEAGLYRVYLGVESGSQRILNKMNKQTTVQENKDAIAVLKKLGIDCTYGFIMFTPWTMEEDIEENVKFLTEVGNIQMNKFFTELLLIPNTAAYKMARSDFTISLKENDTTYYTYPSLTTSVARIREIGNILEKKRADFMNKLWFIHRGIRNAHRRNLIETTSYEVGSNSLFLNIFDFCWKQAKENTLPEIEIVNTCIENFTPQITSFLNTLAEKNLLKVSSFTDEFQYNVS